MKIFIAGTSAFEELLPDIKQSKYVLESFFYIQPWQYELIKTCDMFLLDSGAFSFRNGKQDIDWIKFTEEYAEFINKHDVQYFFELDIDNLIGYEKVKELRTLLEQLTGKQAIPVWHPNRGWDEFVKSTEEYKYVSLGGIVAASPKQKHQYKKLFPKFVTQAHMNGARIHGLGQTGITIVKRSHYDSVDSTSWLSGVKYGNVVTFKNGKFYGMKKQGYRLKTELRLEYLRHNLKEWIKYQKWAEEYL